MKKVVLYILFFLALITLSTCKKYPENTLWFKNPKKLYPFQGNLTKYQVNGIDSLDLLNTFYGHELGLIKDIRRATFLTSINKGDIDCRLNHGGSGLSNYINYNFNKNKKSLTVFFYQDTAIFRKHLFITNSTEWLIIRLAREGSFKLKTKLENGNTYELQIN